MFFMPQITDDLCIRKTEKKKRASNLSSCLVLLFEYINTLQKSNSVLGLKQTKHPQLYPFKGKWEIIARGDAAGVPQQPEADVDMCGLLGSWTSLLAASASLFPCTATAGLTTWAAM